MVFELKRKYKYLHFIIKNVNIRKEVINICRYCQASMEYQ